MPTIVLAAFIEGSRVLMARRADHKKQYPGHWDLIGGHVDRGESLDAALVREAEEEVGLTPTVFRRLGVFNDDENEADYHLYVVNNWQNGRPRLLGDEHTELAWISVSNINTVTPLAHPEIISLLEPV